MHQKYNFFENSHATLDSQAVKKTKSQKGARKAPAGADVPKKKQIQEQNKEEIINDIIF